MAALTVYEIEVPLPCDSVEEFITPFFADVIDFYPEWRAQVEDRVGGDAASFYAPQPYLLLVCKALEKANARAGRDRDEWMNRMLQHFGFAWLQKKLDWMKEQAAA